MFSSVATHFGLKNININVAFKVYNYIFIPRLLYGFAATSVLSAEMAYKTVDSSTSKETNIISFI